MENDTPMFRQYLEIKKLYPGTLLFFRLGDFYELFSDDAVIGSRELEITLTARHKESKNPIPMCGVPYHAAPNYISRLIRKGYRVAICEQTEPAAKGTKLVKREVVRVITPGTAIDPQLLQSGESALLAAITGDDHAVGIGYLDISTGDLSVTQLQGPNCWQDAVEAIETMVPREMVYPQSLQLLIDERFGSSLSRPLILSNGGKESPGTRTRFGGTLTPMPDEYFEADNVRGLLCRQFKVNHLDSFGLADRPYAVSAAGACLKYAQETQKSGAEHIASLNYFESSEFMMLDAITLKNLEVFESSRGDSKRTLLSVIDETVTGMGGRLLRSWLLRPSIKRSEIQTRSSAVAELTDEILRDQIRLLLKQVADLERLVGRLNLGTVSARDLLALHRSISQAPKINGLLADASSLLIQVLSENIFEIPEVRQLIDESIADDPPLDLADGGTIREGFNSELDELRRLSRSVKQSIAAFEEQERTRTGIANLKIRFNGVFGYYIEISKGNLSKVPEDYERRQTLANAERFTTAELREWEHKVLGAEERIISLEGEIFSKIRSTVREETIKLQSTARALATLDALASLAEAAAKRNYVRPILHEGDQVEIRNGRHAIVESFTDESFVPNDLYLNNSTDRLLVITGANMGGKSTILRQIALIHVLAQIGSFVPATYANLPVIDRIWTRVGASDDLASGRSTFMVEMTETASILRNATPRSLILLDEIGRGTSTFDGLSIAWAVAEYLHNSPDHSAKTIFATHYHELTELAETLPGAKNYNIAVTEEQGEIVFLHKLLPGKALRSYGISVASLAGLPSEVIERARNVLSKLERSELAVFADDRPSGIEQAGRRKAAAQVSLFELNNESAIEELRNLHIDTLSPEEVTNAIRDIQAKMV